MSHYSHLQSQSISPYNMEYFDTLSDQVAQINFEVKHIDHFQQERQKKFNKSIQEYKKYLQKQRKALERNQEHCRHRNQWYKEQIKKSWQISISNRPLVLRSLARTNILKRQADEWLSSIDDNVLAGYFNDSYEGESRNQHEQDRNQSLRAENQLKGSKLIDKYNEILSEYFHKI